MLTNYERRQLAKNNIELVDVSHGVYRCNICGREYQPLAQEGGRMPQGWTRCPQCN